MTIEKRRKGVYCLGEKITRCLLVCKRKIFLAVLKKIYDDSGHFGLLFNYVHRAFFLLDFADCGEIARQPRRNFIFARFRLGEKRAFVYTKRGGKRNGKRVDYLGVYYVVFRNQPLLSNAQKRGDYL